MAIEISEKQIKDGWQIVKFGEIAKEVKSTTKDPAGEGLEFYVGLEHLDPQSLRIARKGIIAEDNPSFTRRFSAGQILFGKRRCYQKKAAVADFEGICSGDIIVMDAIPKKIIPGLLPFIIQSDAFFDWAEKTSSGSLSPRTKWKSLAEFEFPLPPIERQKEILEVLEKLEEVSDHLAGTINSARKLWKRTCIELYKNHKQIKIKNNKYIALIDGDRGKNYPKESEMSSTGYCLFLNAKNVTKDGFAFDDCKFITKEKSNILRKGKASREDLVITTRGTVGNIAYFNDSVPYENIRINSGMVLLRAKAEVYSPQFLYSYLISDLFQRTVNILAYGSAQPQLSIKELNSVGIPTPPKREQEEIALKVNTASDAVAKLIKKQQVINNMRSSLSERLLGGAQ